MYSMVNSDPRSIGTNVNQLTVFRRSIWLANQMSGELFNWTSSPIEQLTKIHHTLRLWLSSNTHTHNSSVSNLPKSEKYKTLKSIFPENFKPVPEMFSVGQLQTWNGQPAEGGSERQQLSWMINEAPMTQARLVAEQWGKQTNSSQDTGVVCITQQMVSSFCGQGQNI